VDRRRVRALWQDEQANRRADASTRLPGWNGLGLSGSGVMSASLTSANGCAPLAASVYTIHDVHTARGRSPLISRATGWSVISGST
jgi:hypothetical protein